MVKKKRSNNDFRPPEFKAELMDDDANVTYITLGGHVELNKYRYVYFFIMFIVYILIICSNSIIVYLIWVHQNLHEPMYIFIAALLLNSVVYSTNIYPKLLIDFLSEKQVISYSACLFQFYIFYSFGSSEFFLLSAMAYDRYVSICKPLQYHNIMRKTTVGIFLLFAWLVPACHVAVLTILSAETKLKKAAETCLPHLLVLISVAILSAYDISIARVESNFSKTAHFIMMLQTILYNSLFNPLIYGLKMKEISKHLKRLFCPAKCI
uniref:G-protein coupled receptors family 1 profile domain-containing protein n=1 Tax=Sander lucioperca TaxID=283035 RepID=A0A8C9Z8W5_SANLU